MKQSNRINLLNQLEQLRGFFLWSIPLIIVFIITGYLIAPEIIDFVINWLFLQNNEHLYYFTVFELFFIRLKVAFLWSLIVAYPCVFIRGWWFVLPGLRVNEQKKILFWLILSMLFFWGGVSFNLLFVFPILLKFSMSMSIEMVKPLLGIGSVIEIAFMMSLVNGVLFQIPLLVIFLLRFGIIKAVEIRKIHPYIIMIIFLVSAFFSPPDPFSMFLLAIPICILFELGLVVGKMIVKRVKA